MAEWVLSTYKTIESRRDGMFVENKSGFDYKPRRGGMCKMPYAQALIKIYVTLVNKMIDRFVLIGINLKYHR